MIDTILMNLILSSIGIYVQQFHRQGCEYIQKKWLLCLLVLVIVKRRTRTFRLCLKMYYSFFFSQSSLNITYSFQAVWGVEIQGHLDFDFPLGVAFIWNSVWRSKPNTPKRRSHCWSVSPPCASLFLFTKKASFFLCAAAGLWDYQSTPVPWGKFPCFL